MVSSENSEPGGVDPQFQMFDESPHEEEITSLAYDGDDWTVVLQTRECADRLFRGRLLFRSQGREYRTADLFVDASYEAVRARATNMEPRLLRDLLHSLL
jgi:hypothetical protein